MRERLYRNCLMCAFVLVGSPSTASLRAQPAPMAAPDVHMWQASTSGGSFLGVGVKEIDSDRARELKLREEAGVEITRVEEDSPAAKAGLKVGDAVLQFNGQRVEGIEQFSRFVRETPPGREVKLTVSRDGNVRTIAAKIGSRKGFAYGSQAPFAVEMPRIEIPPMPDIPRNIMMWRSSMLGIEAEPLRGQLADYFGVKEGVLVRSVAKDSTAEKAGLRAGDVILKVNETRVSTPGEVTGALRSLEGKKSVPIVLMRDRKEMTLSATLESDASETPRPARAIRPKAIRPKAIKM
jgi:serine protease Do